MSDLDLIERNPELAEMLLRWSYLEAEREEDYFVLTSGKRSRFYFDCQFTTARTEAMPHIGKAFLDEFRRKGVRPESVGGLTRGADPIALAVAYTSLIYQPIVQSFSVRKARKDHGTCRWIEGYAASGTRVAIVDDVATSGKSVIQAIERAKEERLEIVQVVVLVDREEGGMAAIASKVPGVPVSAIFTRTALEALRAKRQGSGAGR